MNQHLVDRLEAIGAALMAQHAGGTGLPTAVRGDEREVFLREYMQTLFPSHRRFARGAITDAVGRISGQVDVAVEFGFGPSFPMPGPTEGSRLLLADTVALVIEVKSDLSSQWSEVRNTTSSVHALDRRVRSIMTIGGAPGPRIPVFAVGYSGHQTLDGLRKRLDETPELERPDGALVIGSGLYTSPRIWGTGAAALYALAVDINRIFTSVAAAAPDLLAYLSESGGSDA